MPEMIGRGGAILLPPSAPSFHANGVGLDDEELYPAVDGPCLLIVSECNGIPVAIAD
jgi:hypothetical protein